MIAKICSAGVWGIEAYTVEIETNVSLGLPSYTLVGLPDNAVKEGFVRVRAALENCGYPLPPRRFTVNLAPAHIRKDGAAFDLPIALSLLMALGVFDIQDDHSALKRFLWAGELGLQGELRAIRGSLPIALHAQQKKFEGVVFPTACAKEAQALSGIHVYPCGHLSEIIASLKEKTSWYSLPPYEKTADLPLGGPDLQEVRGNEQQKRALEIAAAGGHNLLFLGPPGSGKSMLAKRMPSLLPPMTHEESLEVTSIYSAAGLLGGRPLLENRPFRSPHHDVSSAGLVGGGSFPKPGEISLAHQGVLFLDELLEFKRPTLEALRQPLEDRKITIARARYVIDYPASFSLIAAMNPCPCGYRGSTLRNCICGPAVLNRYRARLSGPLLDRFDLHVLVPHVKYETLLTQGHLSESSAIVRARVIEARERQRERQANFGTLCFNAALQEKHVLDIVKPDRSSINLLTRYGEKYNVSNRSIYRVLKVARTIADLANKPAVESAHIAEALMLRALDRDSS